MTDTLLKIKNLYAEYTAKAGFGESSKIVHALNGINLDIKKGEILSIAGESGCGKSTLAKTIMKLTPVKSGEILFNNRNIQDYDRKEFYTKIQMIFQNPYSSLNPKMKIGEILKEPLIINTKFNDIEIKNKINNVLKKTGLNEDFQNLYPHEFSGGQRQRIAISRALVLNPELIIADEPVSALDVSIQAQIINLLKELKNDYNITLLFISHDLNVIKYISDRIAIMYLGEIVEIGKTNEIFENPRHPYTKLLLNSIPKFNNNENSVQYDSSDIPSPEKLPEGCKFHTRCAFAKDECSHINPDYTSFSQTHCCKCLLYNNYK